MNTALLVLTVLLLLAAPVSHAAFYQWTDADGVSHFTDNPDKIPERHRKKARKLDLMEESSSPRASTSPTYQPPPQVSAPKPAFQGGYGEQAWRRRFSALRGELKALQDGVSDKQAKLVQLRRKRAIYMRARDREAVNAMAAEISADEVRVSDLLKRVDELELEASRAGVPPEWRR